MRALGKDRGVFTADGCFANLPTPGDRRGRPILLLDRDGVLVEDTNYLGRREDVVMIGGIGRVIADAHRAGYICGLVTNQAGIGRGKFDWTGFSDVQDRITSLLAEEGVTLDFVLACPYHPDARLPQYRHAAHPWRKPAPGMLQAAIEHFGAAADRCIMVGDTLTDLQAGNSAGVGRLVHVATGHGTAQRAEVEAWAAAGREVECLESIADLRLGEGQITKVD
jgi:D-glycero-D-manno-heptose 1,7-bisphosphate phosphatase